MKTPVRRFVAIMFLAVSFASASAQISITQSNLSSVLAPGNQLVTITDLSATSLNIGSPGGGNNWNFSGLQTSSFQVLRSVTISSIPPAARDTFPTATHAFRLDTSLSGISGSLYNFLQLSSTQMLNLGAEGLAFNQIPAVRVSVVPAEIVHALPLTMNVRWRTPHTNTVNALGNITITTHDARFVVDGYGRMRMPNGVQHDALRIRKYNFYNGSPVLSYIFLARGYAQVQVDAVSPDTIANLSGTIAIQQGSLIWNYTIVSDPVGVEGQNPVPLEFSLAQNYPNPFNPFTIISYDVAASGLVSLKVFNTLGQEVATLVNETKAPGTYQAVWNAEGMPSGVYFYRMQSGSFTATRRMVVVK
jgi:hypothetical protein